MTQTLNSVYGKRAINTLRWDAVTDVFFPCMSWTMMAKIVIKRESREEKHDDGRLEMKTAPSLAPEGRARRAANLNAQPEATSCES